MKIKGQKPNSEVNSHQQIALLVTNHFFSSFAPVRPRVSFHCPKKQRKTSRSLVKLTSCTILKNRQDACFTKSEFSCGVDILSARERLIDNGALL